MLLTATAAAPAFADPIGAGSSSDQRSGLVLGASVDGGHIGCQTKKGDDCGNGAHPAGGVSLHAGAMLMPRLALIGEMWGMAHTQNSLTATQVLGTVNLRGWVLPRLWLQGGVGAARSQLSFESGGGQVASVTTAIVPAVDAAIGLELLQSSRFGLDVELRAGSGLYEGDVRIYNAALGVGVTFF